MWIERDMARVFDASGGRDIFRAEFIVGCRSWGHAILLLPMVLLLAAPAQAQHVPVFVLNDTNAPPYTTVEGTGYLDAIGTEAFRRAGAELRLVKVPAERGLLLANEGINDGELTRIGGLDAQYPNLVQVPEKLVDWNFAAFSKDASIRADFAVIRMRSVGLIRGWKIYEQAMAGAEHVFTVDDVDELFHLLRADRIDVALYGRWAGLAYIKKHGFTDIRLLRPDLANREMFIYLHKQHADLVPRLAAALRSLKQDGFAERAYRERILPLADGISR